MTAVVDAYHATSGNLEEFEEIVGNAISAAHRGHDSRGVYLIHTIGIVLYTIR